MLDGHRDTGGRLGHLHRDGERLDEPYDGQDDGPLLRGYPHNPQTGGLSGSEEPELDFELTALAGSTDGCPVQRSNRLTRRNPRMERSNIGHRCEDGVCVGTDVNVRSDL